LWFSNKMKNKSDELKKRRGSGKTLRRNEEGCGRRPRKKEKGSGEKLKNIVRGN
jgi:hypothetical protein